MPHDRRPRFTYHPFEVALCGYSGAGKTTLACRLLERWRDRYRVGFVKHDAHRFQMDTPGKDTHRAMEAGAAGVMINDPRHFARISTLPYSSFERAAAFVDADFVLAEGFKRSDLPKLLLLDADGRAEREHREGAFSNVLAVVGPGDAPPDLDGVPFLHRDDVDGIADLVEGWVRQRAEAPLYGLVLAGGESRRMGRPKWAIEYHGEPQAHRTAHLLGDVCERVFLSVRPGQDADGLGLPALPDRFPPWGPAAGILTAMEAHPEAAWLVAACDLPFLDGATLAALVAGRDRLRIATAYRSAHDGLPEPLCAVWEPRARQRLLGAASLGIACPRRVLRESRPRLLDLANARALNNANTPADFEAARAALRPD